MTYATDFLFPIVLALATHHTEWQARGLCLALSGGADSVALLRALCLLRDDEALLAALLHACNKTQAQPLSPPLSELSAAFQTSLTQLHALHCNFGLRGAESEADEAFVRSLCRDFGVRLSVTHFDTTAEARAKGESLEMAARRLRYAWFAGFEGQLLVAHHADDRAETLLLNLLRGSGLRGLAAMPVRNAQGVLRPMLGCTRTQVRAFLAELGQPFREDSSNADTHFRRNALRHELLPQLSAHYPNAAATLSATAKRLQEALAVYELGLQALDAQLFCADSHAEHWRINLPALHAQGQAGEAWLHERLSPLGFSTRQLAEMLRARDGALFRSSAADAYIATPNRGQLEVAREALPPLPEWQLRHYDKPSDFRPLRLPHAATIDADRLMGELRLRYVCAADRFAPYGMQRGTKLVSDLLTERRRSRIEKLRTLCLCDEVGIVWLVGETIAQRVAVSAETQHVLELRLGETDKRAVGTGFAQEGATKNQ